MKMIIGSIAVLMLAGTAWGVTGQISVLSGGASDIIATPGQMIPITLVLNVDGPVAGWQARLTAPDGWQLAPFVGATTNYGPGLPEFDPGGNVGTWSTSANVAFPVAFNVGTVTPSGMPEPIPADKAIFTFTAIAPENVDGQISVSGALVTDENFDDAFIGAVPLNITPEPVSALLLLAGLPMLRRRR